MTTPIYLVKPEDIEDVWPEIKGLISKALMHTDSRMTTYDKLRIVLNRELSLWVGFEDGVIFSALLTRIDEYPQHNILQIVTYATASGRDADFSTIIDTFVEYGRINDCIAMEALCRKGLVKKLPDWKHLYSVISRPI